MCLEESKDPFGTLSSNTEGGDKKVCRLNGQPGPVVFFSSLLGLGRGSKKTGVNEANERSKQVKHFAGVMNPLLKGP